MHALLYQDQTAQEPKYKFSLFPFQTSLKPVQDGCEEILAVNQQKKMVDQIASTLSYNKGVILPTHADEIPYIYLRYIYLNSQKHFLKISAFWWKTLKSMMKEL